ncbi:MAG TPA: hypothetical protein ENK93_00070 [Campylobacteraceae bacterium]|nr:hypothetical protein [Campylobacteraceae bacterium]
MDKYLNNVNENLLVYGGSTLGYRKRAGVNDADDPYADIVAGVGYGRIYDATPYAKAIRILGDLQRYNIVKKDVSKQTVMKLAAIIAKQDEYRSKYSSREYKKYWFDDMGKLLQAEGATESQLDAFGIVRIEEILFEQTIYPRYHGWIVRAGVGQILSNYDNNSKDPTLNLEFAYGLPVGIRGQFFENAKYAALLNNYTGHRFVNTMTYTYELSDIIGWENRWVFDYNKASDNAGKVVHTNTISSTFAYYLSNKLSFNATLSLYKVTDGIDNNGNDNWEQKLFTGLTYRLK